MTLALCRIGVDWNDLYGFEIPYEISDENTPAYPLSNQNIQDIIDGVKTAYPDLSPAEEERIHLALSWVGMGNYAANHGHDFLSVCGTHEVRANVICFDVNCTASDDLGFVNFILKRTGENRIEGNRNEIGSKFKSSTTSYEALRPGDIVQYFDSETSGNRCAVYIGYLKNNAEPIKLQYAGVGISNDDKKVTVEDTLNETISSKVPILVDMDTNGKYGTIYLRGTDGNTLKNEDGTNKTEFLERN